MSTDSGWQDAWHEARWRSETPLHIPERYLTAKEAKEQARAAARRLVPYVAAMAALAPLLPFEPAPASDPEAVFMERLFGLS